MDAKESGRIRVTAGEEVHELHAKISTLVERVDALAKRLELLENFVESRKL